jgi:hypothetical protein
MPEQPIMLRVLLGQRHWQNYATFCAEYDKAARKLDADLKQTFPAGLSCIAGSAALCDPCPTPIIAAS